MSAASRARGWQAEAPAEGPAPQFARMGRRQAGRPVLHRRLDVVDSERAIAWRAADSIELSFCGPAGSRAPQSFEFSRARLPGVAADRMRRRWKRVRRYR